METCLYEGRLTHLRRTPSHRFEMRLFALYLDLAEIDGALAGRWLCSATRPAPLRIRRSDYPGDPKDPLEASIRDRVARSLGIRPSGPIRLLTQPRMFGYGFNPVSFFYCFDSSGSHLEAVVAHVTNTPWNEQHCYVVAPEQPHATTLRARCAKRFHVSPFLPMDLDHEFTFETPGDRLLVHIADVRGGERLFEATLSMRRRPITSLALAGTIVRYPLMSARTAAGIYWNALRLHRKGAPFFAHPGVRAHDGRGAI